MRGALCSEHRHEQAVGAGDVIQADKAARGDEEEAPRLALVWGIRGRERRALWR